MAAQRLGSREGTLAVLCERLQTRRAEIENAVLVRVQGLSDPGEFVDPEYAEGLRAAVSVAVGYGLSAIELGEERCPPPPPLLLAQARLAARNGVGSDTVLRRYFAGHVLLGDCVVEEAARAGLTRPQLQRLLRIQAALFDRLLAAVSEEHARETHSRVSTVRDHRAERIERLLAGELLDTAGVAYEFEGFHLGAIVSGAGAGEALAELARSLDRHLLTVHREEGLIWAWLGSRRRTDPCEVEGIASGTWPSGLSMALGEPGESLAGWRLSHQQARAAFPIVQRAPEAVVRYADVALLASVHQDDLLSTSMRQLYLEPLEHERDGGTAARETLRAYFDADRNASSAAAILGVSRQAIAKRLCAIEEKLGRTVADWAPELEIVLQLESLRDPSSAS